MPVSLGVEERLTASLIFIRNIVLKITNCLHSQLTHRSDKHLSHQTCHQGSFYRPQIQNEFKKVYSIIQSPYCMELTSISYYSNKQQIWFKKTDKATPHGTTPLPYLTQIDCVYTLICRLHVPLTKIYVVELFLSDDVLYQVILYYVSCFVWTPGSVAGAFATANGDPNKIPQKSQCHLSQCQI